MTDAIAANVARKVALEASRAALRSGAKSELESALKSLVPFGSKADRLRDLLKQSLALARSAKTSHPKQDALVTACVSDGVSYEFKVAELDDVAFFVASHEGSKVTVTINSAHPFGKQLLADESWSNSAVHTLLAAWAHYEIDKSDDRRRQSLRDSRVDWGRVVRRILSADSGFCAERPK